jgi:hypothetical protein
MSRIAPSDAFANALGGLTAAIRSSATLSPRLLELGLNCAVAVGIGRMTSTWDVIDEVPEAFRADSDAPVAPWVSGAVVASG